MKETDNQTRNHDHDPTLSVEKRTRLHEPDHDYELDHVANESISKDNPYPFPHHKLDAYHVALELARACQALAAKIPRGYRSLADQLNCAGASIVLNVSEGANKFSPGDKRRSFSHAQGECGEVAGAAELAMTLSLVSPTETHALLVLAGREAAMLTGLINRLR